MQAKTQLQQLIFERRLAALKEYSMAYDKAATIILPEVEKMELEIGDLGLEYFARRSRPEQINVKLNAHVFIIKNKVRDWIAEVNSQRIQINTLFNTNLPQKEYSASNFELDPKYANMPFDKYLEELQETIVDLKNTITEIVKEEQKVINELTSMVKQESSQK